MAHVDGDLRRASAGTQALLGRCDPGGGSRFAAELAELRRTPNGGGVARAELLEVARYDVSLRVAAMSQMLDCAADLLLAAQVRAADDELRANSFGLTLVARSMVEVLAVNRYLTTPDVDASERVRRYFVWRFDQFRSDRNLIEAVGLTGEERTEAQEAERELVAQARRCGIDAREGTWKPGGPHAAVEGVGRMPATTELVDGLLPERRGLYRLLSFGPHGTRSGIHATIANEQVDGKVVRLDMAAPGLDVQVSVMASAWALLTAGRDLAEWCGTDHTTFDRFFEPFLG